MNPPTALRRAVISFPYDEPPSIRASRPGDPPRGGGPPTRAQGDVSSCLDHLALVGDLAGVALLVYDERERVVFANAGAALLLGAPHPEAVVGRHMLDFVPMDQVSEARERRRLIRSGLDPDPGDFDVVRLDGTRRTAYVTSAEVRHQGHAARLVIARDVTTLREAERNRHQLEEQLAASRRLEGLGRLAGGVAHDFNNLLTVISGFTELALSEAGPKSAIGQSLLHIDDAAERAAGLTRQLLAFGRRQVLRPSTLDLNEVIGALGPMLTRLIGEDVSLELRASEQPCRVRADRGQLEQVIMNLVMNGRDAMPDGGGLVIETRRVHGPVTRVTEGLPAAGGWHVMLAVTDEGEGMDQATADRIFEPFFSTKAQGRGTGLGLATVYGIVKQSGGAIEVESALGQGSTFRIWLPEASSDGPGTADVDEGSSSARSVDASGRILLVEDDPPIRSLAHQILRRAGFSVRCAGSAEDALELVRAEAKPFDLLITDVILPGMDGPTLADAVRREAPEVRVLFISGYTAERIGSKGVIGPGVELLEKPFSPRALVRRAREVLDRD